MRILGLIFDRVIRIQKQTSEVYMLEKLPKYRNIRLASVDTYFKHYPCDDYHRKRYRRHQILKDNGFELLCIVEEDYDKTWKYLIQEEIDFYLSREQFSAFIWVRGVNHYSGHPFQKLYGRK